MTEELQYGTRTAVMVTVPQKDVARVNHALLTALGYDMLGARAELVYLPTSLYSFGVRHSLVEPGAGLLVGLKSTDTHELGSLQGLSIHLLSTYFGWVAPTGVRIEFITHDGATYHLAVTYDHTGEFSEENDKLALVKLLLRLGKKSTALALTKRAGGLLEFDRIVVPRAQQDENS